MKRSSEWMDGYGSLIRRTANLPPSKRALSDTGRVHLRFRFSFERPAIDEQTLRCNTCVGRKRPIDAVSAPDSPLYSLAKRFKHNPVDPLTFKQLPNYLLADVFESVSALKRPTLRRVCRSWNFLLNQKSLSGNNICVVESGKVHQSKGDAESERREVHHVAGIRQAISSSTTSLVMLFPSQRHSSGSIYILDSILWKHLRSILLQERQVERLVLVNCRCQDFVLFPRSYERWDRPLNLTLINCQFELFKLTPKVDWRFSRSMIPEMSVQLVGDFEGNYRAMSDALEEFVWPFNDASQLDWVVQNAPLLRRRHQRDVRNYLIQRFDYLDEVPNFDVHKWTDHVASLDKMSISVIACYLLRAVDKRKIPAAPLAFPEKGFVRPWPKASDHRFPYH